MTTSPPALQADASNQLAASVSGFDPTPVITAADQRLADYLAKPTHHIIDQFGLHQAPTNPGGPINAGNPHQLISHVHDALSTLGSGQFPGPNPATMLNEISGAFDNVAVPMQQALSAVQQGWQGASSAAAATKTAAALANGSEVATQAKGLQASLSAAAADVAQARAQLIAIINEFQATLAAIGPNIIFPWGWAAAVAAAAKAVAHSSQVMAEVQSSLAAHAAAVTAIGTPVAVTAAPQLGTSAAIGSMAGPLGSLLGLGSSPSASSALGALSPLMNIASTGISPVMSAVSMAGQAAGPAASVGAQSATLAGSTDADPKPKDGREAPGGAAGGAGGAIVSAGGGGPAAGALISRGTLPMMAATAEPGITAMPVGATRAAVGTVPAGGGGMMGAPLGGAGQGTGGAHTAASFLHTSDQGGKVVGNRETVAPPVIGEADPYDTPDIELRI